MEVEIPIAIYHSKRRRDKIWDVIVEDCPFCHHKHTHGGGKGEILSLGSNYRVSHCFKGTYQLKEDIR